MRRRKGYQLQAEDQGRLLRDANAQLATSKEQVLTLQTQLEEVQKLRDQAEKAKAEVEKGKDVAEQQGYNAGIAETEENFRAEVPVVCREYCALTWQEALDRAGVGSSSELRKPENIYFPPAIRVSTSSTPIGEVSAIVAEPPEEVQTQASPTLGRQEQSLVPGKEKDLSSAKEVSVEDGVWMEVSVEDGVWRWWPWHASRRESIVALVGIWVCLKLGRVGIWVCLRLE
nr:hypothetical protein CFP56_05487 [Quercus suber]